MNKSQDKIQSVAVQEPGWQSAKRLWLVDEELPVYVKEVQILFDGVKAKVYSHSDIEFYPVMKVKKIDL